MTGRTTRPGVSGPIAGLVAALARGLVLAVLAFPRAAPAAPPTTPDVERFFVEAAVGGVVRANLRDIGRAVVEFTPPGVRPLRVRAAVTAHDPERQKHYKFKLDMAFALSGRLLSVLDSRNRFNTAAAKIKDRIERVVPFIHLVRLLPVPEPADEPTRSLRSRDGYFVLRYRRAESLVEVSLHRDDELVARFSIEPRTGRAARLESFSIPAGSEVTVRFRRFSDPNGFGNLTVNSF